MRRGAAGLVAAALAWFGCGPLGKVEQGRVVGYNAQTQRVTLILEDPAGSSPGVLPPVTIETPADPTDMGPAPAAGGLMLLDTRKRQVVIYDRAMQALRTINYQPLAERRHVAANPGPPVVDRAAKTITLYAAKDHALITFGASDDLLAMPADTWRAGDVVRYYYKQPGRALRLMNVTRTDLSKSAG